MKTSQGWGSSEVWKEGARRGNFIKMQAGRVKVHRVEGGLWWGTGFGNGVVQTKGVQTAPKVWFLFKIKCCRASPTVVQLLKCLPGMHDAWVRPSLCRGTRL